MSTGMIYEHQTQLIQIMDYVGETLSKKVLVPLSSVSAQLKFTPYLNHYIFLHLQGIEYYLLGPIL